MIDIPSACAALEKLLALKTINHDARYYAELARSHLRESVSEEAKTPQQQGRAPDQAR